MNAPRRWIEDKSESTPLERALLRPALQVAVPPGAEQRIWTRLIAAAPLAAATLTASSVASGSATTALVEAGAASVTGVAAGGVPAIGAGSVKLGVAVIAKAFAIGTASGALFAGGLGAILPAPSTREAADAPVATAPHQPEKALPRRATSASRVTPPVATENAAPIAPAPAPSVRSPARPAAPESAHGRELGNRTPGTGSVSTFPSVSSPPAPPASSRLREEARILRSAREALRQGNLPGAFAALEVARTEFPRGALGEEREALTIELLARSGQREAARLRAQAFLQRFPRSPYATNVRPFAF